MKVSLQWLSDFVDISEYFEKPEGLAEALTRGGLEVEEIRNSAIDFQNVVVGMVLKKEKHSGSDRLSVCQVTTGDGVLHQIVCGATNHNADDRVVVALPGAHLPNGMKIGRAAVRGVDSAGMLCSEDELGLSNFSQDLGMPSSKDGIILLPKDAPLGTPFAKYAQLEDVTMEIKVTPNRADCLSHLGLAREISCLLERPLKEKAPVIPEGTDSTGSKITVDVQAGEACPRYCGRFISNVKVGPSPGWLRKRLETAGLRSINNVVDVTNYVMLEMGQPLHAFDAAEIKGSKIVVTPAKTGERFEALDGKKIEFKGGELLIRDGERAVALAGVIGGLQSGVTDGTQNVFLESAYFEPSQVRRTSRAHGIQTDSAYRFSRGVNPQATRRAMDRATELILSVAGGTAFKDAIDIYPRPIERKWIPITVQTVSDRMGYPADEKLLESFCTRLGCEVKKAGGGFEILPPVFRMDIENDMDLVEEYGRLNGYEKIPETLPALEKEPARHDAVYVLDVTLSQKLRSAGFAQAMSSAFVAGKEENEFLGDRQLFSQFGLPQSPNSVGLLNPLSEELNRLRATVSFGLWKCAERNFHQGVHAGRVFETAKVAFPIDKGGYGEQFRLGLCAWGHALNLWSKAEHPIVFELKRGLESALSAFGRVQVISTQVSETSPKFLHRGQTGKILLDDKVIGFLGTVHPGLLEDSKIRVPVALAEIRLDGLENGLANVKRYQPFSRWPMIERDLSLVMSEEHPVGEIEKFILGLGDQNLKGVQVFDVYAGDKLPERTKAVGFRLNYQGASATLRDEEVQVSVDRVLHGLKEKFGAQLR